ncbi:hypothetical protein AK812_SmicGene24745 [Symbiodinium microadriaticum]|uniref:Uncharacterized protein n=1 Tax=Symbiodinium microadriaticum TaxID=2951 RepID=A0A1Q9DE60_SYMMI|nr:hypothetical protein AK812_SmicGene24745 [Symbiodinium microadriaticum]CAE7452661.1 unnamed protein product [Symbiodinium microadriaticum]CAE7870813.1 unnamed protein product [Symbiodinium sp. KB8]
MSQMVIPQELLQMLQQLQQHHVQLEQMPDIEHLRNATHAVGSDLEGRSNQLARAVQFQMGGITSVQDHLTDLQRQTAAGEVKREEMMRHVSGCLEDLKHMQSALQMFAVEIKAGQWKLLQDVPSLNMPSGEPWECGLQLQQWISEFTTVASCVALEFNQYFLKHLETAKSRYDARQIQLKPEDIEAPPVTSHCEEMENRLSLTLMRILPEQLRKI